MRSLIPALLLSLSIPSFSQAPARDDFADYYDTRITRTVVQYRKGSAVQASYYSPSGSLSAIEFFSNGKPDSITEFDAGGVLSRRLLIKRDANGLPALTLYEAVGIETVTDQGKIDSILGQNNERSLEQIAGVISRNKNALSELHHRYFSREPLRQGDLTARLSIRPDGSVDRVVFMNKNASGRDFYADVVAVVRAMQFDPVTTASNHTVEVIIPFDRSAPGSGPRSPKISRTSKIVLSVVGIAAISGLVWTFLYLKDKKT